MRQCPQEALRYMGPQPAPAAHWDGFDPSSNQTSFVASPRGVGGRVGPNSDCRRERPRMDAE
jgi:hypothetical protein